MPPIPAFVVCLILAFVPSAWSAERMYVGVESANIRSAPDGEVIGNLERGSAVDVHDHDGQWSRVSADYDVPEWIHASLLCSDAFCSERVRADSPDIRRPLQSNAYRATTQSSSRARSRQAASRPSTAGTGKRARRARSNYSSGSCPCSGYANCTGPRGGQYCITSGGNKRYR